MRAILGQLPINSLRRIFGKPQANKPRADKGVGRLRGQVLRAILHVSVCLLSLLSQDLIEASCIVSSCFSDVASILPATNRACKVSIFSDVAFLPGVRASWHLMGNDGTGSPAQNTCTLTVLYSHRKQGSLPVNTSLRVVLIGSRKSRWLRYPTTLPQP